MNISVIRIESMYNGPPKMEVVMSDIEFDVPLEQARLCADDPAVLAELAAHPDVDVVLNAVVGFAGLPATLAALEHGKRLALANKESLIACGPVVAAKRHELPFHSHVSPSGEPAQPPNTTSTPRALSPS